MRSLLIVEDEPDLRTMLVEIFAGDGYSVAEAASVDEGLRKLRSTKPSLVLLDYGIPSMRDGETFLRSKASEPEIAPIPVVLMSGYILPAIDGVVAFVGKPFTIDRIVAVVRKFSGAPDEPARVAYSPAS